MTGFEHINMDARKASEMYLELIEKRRKHPAPWGVYGEKHHIIPRSCGGSDDDENLVRLYPQEHFAAHYLLPFIFASGEKHRKMKYAFELMSDSGKRSPDDYAKHRLETLGRQNGYAVGGVRFAAMKVEEEEQTAERGRKRGKSPRKWMRALVDKMCEAVAKE